MLIPGASEKKKGNGGGEAPICQLWVRSFVLRVRKEEEEDGAVKKILALVCKPLPLPFRSATAADLPIF